MKTFQLPIDKIIIQLGYKSSGKLFMSNQFQNAPLSPQSKRILKEINPYAAYIVDNAPFVLFFDKIMNDDSSFKKVSKQVWNAQIPVNSPQLHFLWRFIHIFCEKLFQASLIMWLVLDFY